MALVIVATKLCPNWRSWNWDLTIPTHRPPQSLFVPWSGLEVDEMWRTDNKQHVGEYLQFCEKHLDKNATSSERFNTHVDHLRKFAEGTSHFHSQNNDKEGPKRTICFSECRMEVGKAARTLQKCPNRVKACCKQHYMIYKNKRAVEDISRFHTPYAFILYHGAKFLDVAPDVLHRTVHKIDLEVEKISSLGRAHGCRVDTDEKET